MTISKVNGIAYTALAKVNGIAKAALSKVNGSTKPGGGTPATYTSQPNETDGIDIRIVSSTPDTNYNAENILCVGEINAGASVQRTLIKFDLSSIPANATIVSATLSLWTAADFSTNARDYKIYRVKRAWVEANATWNVYTTGNSWGTVGCSNTSTDYDTTVWATKNFGNAIANNTQMDFVFDATGLAELTKFIDGTNTNNGWIIRADTESEDAYTLHSSSGATAGFRPKLVIEYTTP